MVPSRRLAFPNGCATSTKGIIVFALLALLAVTAVAAVVMAVVETARDGYGRIPEREYPRAI